MAGRAVVTALGLEGETSARLVGSFAAHGASQCGFCTPGILCRLAALGPRPEAGQVESALLAHLCRCTGWRTIVDAALGSPPGSGPVSDPADSARRAELEGRTAQRTGPDVVLGGGGFADDGAPPGCLVAVPDGRGGWAVAATLAEARAASGKVQGRRSGRDLDYPIDVPPGEWALTLQTTWVEPAYLEPDSSWCEPGGEPAQPARNGGAFGGKASSAAPTAARALADRYGRPVRVVFAREDVVRLGPKRPPIAAGVAPDGSGVLRVARAAGVAEAVAAAAPAVHVEEVDVAGPPVSAAIRAAGWAEAAVLIVAGDAIRDGRVAVGEASGDATAGVRSPDGAEARASVRLDDSGWPAAVDVWVRCGDPLDPVVLRSYVTGAAHMALGWVCSEAVALDEDRSPADLTIRSFGILRARDTPPITVTIDPATPGEAPTNGSDAAFAAVAAATWMAQGLPPRWPTRRGRTQ